MKKRDTIQELADSLTDEQIMRLYEIAHPISEEDRKELDKLTLDDIERELTA